MREDNQQREINKIQIYRAVVKDKILDISEMLTPEPRHCKLVLNLVEFDQNNKATSKVRHYVDSDDFKLVCHDLLQSSFTQFEDHKGSSYDGHIEARVLHMKRETKYRQPYVVRIDNGHGEVVGTGQVKMIKVTDSLTIQLSDFEARKLALTVLDYVRQWETINFRQRRLARQVTFAPTVESDNYERPLAA